MSSYPKKAALELLRQNRKFKRSWRTIAREDFASQIKPGTLCRFAKARGKWIPVNQNLKEALHLIEPPRIHQPRLINEMTDGELIEALKNRTTMEEADPKMLKGFINACVIASLLRREHPSYEKSFA